MAMPRELTFRHMFAYDFLMLLAKTGNQAALELASHYDGIVVRRPGAYCVVNIDGVSHAQSS